MVEESINQRKCIFTIEISIFDVILSLKVYSYGGLINE